MIEVVEGGSPLILSFPHTGTEMPEEVAERLSAAGRTLHDTDWNVHRLYDFAARFDPTTVRTPWHRYLIDVNRDPEGASLYPGRATTGLCPTTTFDGRPLYEEGAEPGALEIEVRRAAFFDAYHDALAEQVTRVVLKHGYALLFDCHSIRSKVPRLFEGTLPVFSLGTFDGRSCAPAIREALADALRPHDHVIDGRFKGGWITRHYGRPQDGVHAVQMELAQRAYMDERPPYPFRDDRADPTRAVLDGVLEAFVRVGGEVR